MDSEPISWLTCYDYPTAYLQEQAGMSKFGVNITMGASNISFGLPDRKYVNSAFIAMAIQAGLTCPITNPLVTEVSTAVLAADLSMGKDEFGMRWIKGYRKRQEAG